MHSRILRKRPTSLRPRRRWALASARRGLAALEFAIVLPILLTILLGATDFGRFSHSRIAVVNAARCGAAYASMNPYDSANAAAWNAGVKNAVTDELGESSTFDPDKLVITTSVATDSGGRTRMSVTVSYPFEMLMQWPLLPSSMDLQDTVVMPSIR